MMRQVRNAKFVGDLYRNEGLLTGRFVQVPDFVV